MISRTLLLLMLFVSAASAQNWGTGHNLSPGSGSLNDGPDPTQDCMECHTPHHANPTKGLWNRKLSGVTYQLYESPTLNAQMQQPTGSSRLCLSCHDGTIAMVGPRIGRRRVSRSSSVLSDQASLGVDLSDDHPISFEYDAVLATQKDELIDPSLLPHRMQLEAGRWLQCTTCHDPHEVRTPDFLVVDNRFSRLCLSCHRPENWPESVHATSTATWDGRGSDPWPHTEYVRLDDNACANCHATHSSGQSRWLLTANGEEETCLSCHDGTVAAKNIEAELQKPSAHLVSRTQGVHGPSEDPSVMPRHVECSDCHSPHQMQATESGNPSELRTMQGAPGVDASGNAVTKASYAYEVCFKCHGLRDVERAVVMRVDPRTNPREEFDAGNASYHPVVALPKEGNVVGLINGLSSAQNIGCTDCHNSDATSGTEAASGPHGSIYPLILEREYQMSDPTPESSQSYSLCYKCHDRQVLFSERSGFSHRLHVAEGEASCATCHDAHGSRRNSHLVNFMALDASGNAVVLPSATGLLEFEDLGRSAANCYLTCHGVNHDPLGYRR